MLKLGMKTQASTIAVLALIGAYSGASAQTVTGCEVLVGGEIPDGCEHGNAGDVIARGLEPNTEPDVSSGVNSDGFVLSLDGVAVDADPTIEEQVRRIDVAIAQADVRVQVNTLDPEPRLDVEVAGAPRAYGVGETVTLISEMNYPAFVTSAEMRIIDRAAPGGPRLMSTVPVDANGRANVVIPQGADIVVVHRVYDARGRYDETTPLALMRPDTRGQVDDVEEGTQSLARRGIRVAGGTVTVSATDVAPGGVLRTMGEEIRPDSRGRAVIERILPAGSYDVDVALAGGGQNVSLQRPVEIAGAEWFFVGAADLTYGRYTDVGTGERFTRADGRLQFYIDGETLSGYRITSSIDTQTGELEDIFRRFNDRTAAGVLDRVSDLDGYPTYGDDSTIVDDTPTSGNFYLRVEQDNNFLVWGDFIASLEGNGYVRNDRNLYGLQGHYETPTTTSRGDAQASVDVYGAQPDELAARDVFVGTGGSVYFLRNQDISPGTANVIVEVRDIVTGRITEQVALVRGRDFDLNDIQGVVTLTRPLSGSADRRLISSELGGDEEIRLVVQYEYAPTGASIDGMSYGGRVEGWLTDDVRLGFTATSDDNGVDDHRTFGADLRYEIGNNSFVQLDFAESDGPGSDFNRSTDGGLVFGTETALNATGNAFRLETQLDLADIGYSRRGVIGGYAEQREEGFSSFDYNVTADTGDETLYGLFARVEADGGLGYALYADVYENDVGNDRTEIGGEVEGHWGERLRYAVGVEYLSESTDTTDGSRLDVAARIGFVPRDDLSYFAFVQTTLDDDGLGQNNRYGVGLNSQFGQNWSADAVVSGGTGGAGGRIAVTQQSPDNNSTYFGYELDPSRAREAGITSDGGRYVIGGRRQISDHVAMFGENTYDLFGDRRELISAYGLTYTVNDYLSYTGTIDFGQLDEDTVGDIDRIAVSFGMRYSDEDLTAAARLELRQDDYEDPDEEDTDAVFFTADARWTLSEESRVLATADLAWTETNGVSFNNGRYADVSLGYAHRPINNERLNTLARYRYFYDSVGQEVDGIASSGPVQESHVVSLEANYDLSQTWTLTGKLGGRFTESAPAVGGVMTSNDAWLAVANARYHLVHNWDVLLELRHLELTDAGSANSSILGAAYRHVGENAMVGLGYNFGQFSDDLTDLTFDDEGVFVNLIANF